MRLPVRTIWDTKIQCVCAVVTAQDRHRVEMWMCGNFARAGLNPPMVIVNPNVLYPIEGVMRREGRFAINIFAQEGKEAILRMVRVRRRTPNKERVLGMPVRRHERHGIPYIPGCQSVLFCELVEPLETGDHTAMVARVLEHWENPAQKGQMPLLYPEVSGNPPRFPRLSRAVRVAATQSGLADFLRRQLQRRRPPPAADLRAATYELGGQNEREIEQILSYGALDEGRVLTPEIPAPAAPGRKVSICVVGLGQWGSFHCQLFRQAGPEVELYVCGRDAQRAGRLARAIGAKDVILGLEQAVEDKRVEALSLVLPHHMHASAVEMAVARGKHVMVEKPIANSMEDARRMIESARRAGVVFMVAEDVHFRAAVREAARGIDRGDIGEPLFLKVHAGGSMRPRGWKANADLMGGGVLMDLGVHYVRALRMILGEPDRVLACKGMQIDTKMGGEDSVQVLFESRYGWQAHFLLSWAGPRGLNPDIIVSGDQGVFQIWPGKSYYDHIPAQPLLLPRLISYVRPARLAERLMRPELQRVRRPLAGSDVLGYLTQAREFVSAVGERRAPVSDPVHALRDLEIVLCGYRSMEAGGWVEIPPFSTPS